MQSKTFFHLARHGQTDWNIEHRIQGQLDSPLTTLGKQQASQLARRCESLPLTTILCSPLGRAVETADICARHLKLNMVQVKGLEERNFGLWQGKLSPAMKQHKHYTEITSQLTDLAPEQGESAKQMLTRFENSLVKQFTASPDEQYLIITHGDALRCFFHRFLTSGHANTGYDFKNCQLLSFCYDHQLQQFSRL